MSQRTPQTTTEKVTRPGQETGEPPLFRVLMHNDDYTTMDFVVAVLCSIFKKPVDDAVRIMLSIHHEGVGMCGVYPCQIAETKVAAVHARARESGFPLRCTLEPE